MHPAWFETRFRTPAAVDMWPEAFAIITAYATTGEAWPADENAAADRRLSEELEAEAGPVVRVTGYHPGTGHAEPGWAVALPFERVCDVGLRYRQDAIYYVTGDDLSVSYCDARRARVPVGGFRERLSVGGEGEP